MHLTRGEHINFWSWSIFAPRHLFFFYYYYYAIGRARPAQFFPEPMNALNIQKKLEREKGFASCNWKSMTAKAGASRQTGLRIPYPTHLSNIP